ncbi:MAG: aspartate-semialdehyde dehydrogenase [Candidatus Dormibacteraceae bacterium]
MLSSSPRTLNVAVVGATGIVGRELFRVLEQRKFPIGKLKAVASERSVGMEVRCNGYRTKIEALAKETFKGVDIALFSAGSAASLMWAPMAVEAGAMVIDNSSAWRMRENVPLVVPEVNSEDIRLNQGIIANPNCCAIPLAVVLEPLRRRAGLRRVVVSTYQAASGAGKALVNELEEQVSALAEGDQPRAVVYPQPLANNVVPGGWPTAREGYNEEEIKIIQETQKILHQPGLRLAATCVRVPVAVGHGEAVFVETEEMIAASEARTLFGSSPGIVVVDDPPAKLYPTPNSVVGRDEVYVGRIRNDLSSSHGLALWIVCDNLRKGAALNAVQIAEQVLALKAI